MLEGGEALAFILISVQIKSDKVIKLNTDHECLRAFISCPFKITSVQVMSCQIMSDKVTNLTFNLTLSQLIIIIIHFDSLTFQLRVTFTKGKISYDAK